jgi:hypothetical protein
VDCLRSTLGAGGPFGGSASSRSAVCLVRILNTHSTLQIGRQREVWPLADLSQHRAPFRVSTALVLNLRERRPARKASTQRRTTSGGTARRCDGGAADMAKAKQPPGPPMTTGCPKWTGKGLR